MQLWKPSPYIWRHRMHFIQTSPHVLSENSNVSLNKFFYPTNLSLRTFFAMGRMQFWPTCWNVHAKGWTSFTHKSDSLCENIGFSIRNFFVEYIIRASRMHFWHSWRKVFATFRNLYGSLQVFQKMILLKMFLCARRTQFRLACQ